MKKMNLLIIEDADGIAKAYKEILKTDENLDLMIANSGLAVQSLINKGEKFDLAIVDIMVPVEDNEKYSLSDGHETGLRLINNMINKDICRRFYIITVLEDIEGRIKSLCKGKAVFIFEDKISHEPEELLTNVQELLKLQPPA